MLEQTYKRIMFSNRERKEVKVIQRHVVNKERKKKVRYIHRHGPKEGRERTILKDKHILKVNKQRERK